MGGPLVSKITSTEIISLRSFGLALVFCRNKSMFEITSVIFIFCKWTERTPERWSDLRKMTQLLSAMPLLGTEPQSLLFHAALDGPRKILRYHRPWKVISGSPAMMPPMQLSALRIRWECAYEAPTMCLAFCSVLEVHRWEDGVSDLKELTEEWSTK